MTLRHIPPKETRRWTGIYPGRFYGTLWNTFNVDLDRNEGAVGLAQRFDIIEDSTETPDLGGADSGSDSNIISAFLRTDADGNDRFWAMNRNAMFKTDSAATPVPTNDWDTDGLDSSPTARLSDMAVIGNDSRNDSGNNKLFVTQDSDIDVLNDTGDNAWTGAWWVTKQGQPGLDTSVPHPIEFFPFRKIGLVGDGNLIHTIHRPSDTQNDTVSYQRLTLPKDLVVNHIFTTSNRSWICCYHRKSGQGAVVEWDGFTESYNEIHHIDDVAVLSGVDYGGTPIIVSSKGRILEFSGNGFTTMMRNGQEVAFPVAESVGHSLIRQSSNPLAVTDFRMASRGITIGQDELIYMSVSSPVGSAGLFGTFERRQGGGVWCLNPKTGRLYYKHSFPQANSAADFGQQFPYKTGALYTVPGGINAENRSLLAGASVGGGADSSMTGGIWLLDDYSSVTAARGSFITQYIPADDVKEFWDLLLVHYQMNSSVVSGEIVVKARGTRPLTQLNGLPLQGLSGVTWTSTTTFTVTLNNGSDDALAIDDEVEIVRGVNSGRTAHITAISGNHAELQTITIDEAVNTGSGTSVAVFERWKKLGSIADDSTYEKALSIGIDSSFIQFKIEMRGRASEVEIFDFVVKSNNSQEIEN